MKEPPSYTKILGLGSAYTENALIGHVTIQEKVDGSQFGWGKNEDGEIVCRSKGQQLFKQGTDKMFKPAVDFIFGIQQSTWDLVPNDTYFYGEYLQKPKHNVLKYDRIPSNHLVLFDVFHVNRWATAEELKQFAELLGVDLIPQLYFGDATVDTIKELLTTDSFLGGEKIEGVVIKNYGQTILLGGRVFSLFTKFVRESFKERHSLEWKQNSPKNSLQEFLVAFKTEPRWQKSIIHAKEQGILTNSPKDIGVLLEKIHQDIREEEETNIKNYLYKQFIGEILRASTAGFPEWYKNKLLENLKEANKDGNN